MWLTFATQLFWGEIKFNDVDGDLSNQMKIWTEKTEVYWTRDCASNSNISTSLSFSSLVYHTDFSSPGVDSGLNWCFKLILWLSVLLVLFLQRTWYHFQVNLFHVCVFKTKTIMKHFFNNIRHSTRLLFVFGYPSLLQQTLSRTGNLSGQHPYG